jgi:hypothetical protein
MITALALLAVLSAPDSAASAASAQAILPVRASAFTLRGKGMRNDFTLGGAISRAANGRVRGDFVIIITTPTDTSTACRYRKFTKVVRNGGTVTFDATGDCVTVAPSGAITEWEASNAFAVVQGNGKTPDTIDVNMYGANGITIPGGTLDSGDFELL